MVRKNTLILSLIISALLMSVIHINPEGGPHYMDSPLVTSSWKVTGMNIGSFAAGVLIEYGVFLIAVYLLLRGISKKFER